VETVTLPPQHEDGVMRIRSFIFFTVSLFVLCGRAEAGTLYAATAGDHGELYILDPATGGVQRDVGPLNDAAGRNYPVTGLAVHPVTGALFGSTHDSPTGDPATVSRLVSINAVTAEVTVIGPLYFDSVFPPPAGATMADLAFDRAGNLYGIASLGRTRIYSIDFYEARAYGANSSSSSAPVEGGGLVSFSNYEHYLTPTADVLSHWFLDCCSHRPGLYQVPVGNPAKPAGGGNYGALDFDGDVLFGLNVGPGSPPQTHLVIINTANAAVTDIGRSVDALEAIAFRPDYLPTPEPASWALAALACGPMLLIAVRHNSTRPVLTAVVTVVFCWPHLTDADAAEYSFINVADTTTMAPSGTFSSFQLIGNVYVEPPALSGTNVAFVAAYDNGTQSGVFRGSGGPLTTIAKTGDLAPLDVFREFNTPAISSEMVAFQAGYDNIGHEPIHGIFMGNGGLPTVISREGDRVSGYAGSIGGVFAPAFNGNTVGFDAFINTGPSSSHKGIFSGTGGPLTTLVSDYGTHPYAPAFSDGSVAFAGWVNGGNFGVFRRTGNTTTNIAHSGDTVSGVRFDDTLIGEGVAISGDNVVFFGRASSGGAIFAGSGGPLTLVANRGDPAPVGTFTGFRALPGVLPSITGDTVAFAGQFADGLQSGIFTSTDGLLATVVKSGDPLFGSTVANVTMGRFGLDPGGSGNLAFWYQLVDGRQGVALAREILESIPGDYNGNGAVDAADYVVWRNTLGNTGTGLAADGNGNDTIDAGDYDVWRANFGQTAASEGIPEPGGLALLVAAVLSATLLCRTRSLNLSVRPHQSLTHRSSGRAQACCFVLSKLTAMFVCERAGAGPLWRPQMK
jgi:hypothetical protein